MSTQSNVCACAVCTGSECKCGCQNPGGRLAAPCQCGEVCSCGPTCNCKGCQHANARQSESRQCTPRQASSPSSAVSA
jgi:hypothetical protein